MQSGQRKAIEPASYVYYRHVYILCNGGKG
jgi:hypothetical protein